MSQSASTFEQATLGGGCFWCLEAVFEQLEGVERVESGYAGGETLVPNYQAVCTGKTGHAEVVQVTFDPVRLSYSDVLDVFFSMHDPTTLNRQGADVGTQYRSAIFYHSAAQKETAEKKIAQLKSDGVWIRPIVTEIVPLQKFHKGEGYHQDYYRQNPEQGYCQAVISPKLAKLRQKFAKKLKGHAS